MQRTEGEKQAWKAKMGLLAKQIKAMPKEEQQALACKCGTMTCEGRTLSPFNTCYLWLQNGRKPLLQVGGFKQWQKIGRIVKKGEHSVGCIFVPIAGKKDDEGHESNTYFRRMPVFDVEQTETMQAAG